MEVLSVAQIIVSILLIISILLQQRGSSASGILGGTGETYFQKRGMEEILFKSTIFLSIIFFALAIANFIL